MITCKKCGAQISEQAAFCSSCGAKVVSETVAAPVNNGMPYQNGQPVNNGMPYQNGQPVNYGMPYQGGYNPYGGQNTAQRKKKKTGLIIGILVAAIAIIAVVLVLILGGGSNRSYKAVTKQFMNGIIKHDLSMMVETAAPESYQKKMMEELLADYDEDEIWDEFDENAEWYCGSHVKYSYEIEEANRMDEDDLADVEDDLWEDYDYRANVTDGYELRIVLHAKGDDDTYDQYSDLTVIKIKGKWYTYWW